MSTWEYFKINLFKKPQSLDHNWLILILLNGKTVRTIFLRVMFWEYYSLEEIFQMLRLNMRILCTEVNTLDQKV